MTYSSFKHFAPLTSCSSTPMAKKLPLAFLRKDTTLEAALATIGPFQAIRRLQWQST